MLYTQLTSRPFLTTENNFNIENDQIIKTRKIVVHTFTLADVDDPEIYAAEPLLEWERSEQGQWVMANAVSDVKWNKFIDQSWYGYRYKITAELKESDISYFLLKWGSK